MDDLQKSLMRDMIREELATLLPAALAEAMKGQAAPPVVNLAWPDMEPLYAEMRQRMANMEGQTQNLINSTESRVSQQLAALAVLDRTGG